MDPATLAMLAKAGLSLGEMGMDMAKGFAGGKQAENIGNYNEQQSAQDRLKARLFNEDPDQQGDRAAESTQKGKNAASALNRNELIFNNQLEQSNKRADLQNSMAATDQVAAYKRGEQLANNYLNASNAQAQASGNLANAVMNRQATQYRSNI